MHRFVPSTLILSAGILTMLVTSLHARQGDQNRETSPENPKTTPLLVQFLGFLNTDEDVQSQLALSAVRTSAKSGYLAQAGELKKLIYGYRKPIANLAVAAQAIQAQQRELADSLIQSAEGNIATLLDWQQRRAQGEMAHVKILMGEEKIAHDIISKLPPEGVRYDMECKLFSVCSAGYISRHLEDFVSLKEPAARQKGEAILGAAEVLANEDWSKSHEYLTRALPLLAEAPDVTTTGLYARASRLYSKLGLPGEAWKAAESCEKLGLKLSNLAEWKPRDLAVSAELFLELGDPKRAEALVLLAEKCGDQADLFGYPATALAIADAFLVIGNHESATRYASRALAMAELHPHHRAKAMAAAEVLIWLTKHHLEPTEVLNDQFARVARLVTEDPHYAAALVSGETAPELNEKNPAAKESPQIQ